MRKLAVLALAGTCVILSFAYFLTADGAPKLTKSPTERPAEAPRKTAVQGGVEPVSPITSSPATLDEEVETLLRYTGPEARLKAHNLVARCAREISFSRKQGAQVSSKECAGLFAKYGNQYMQWLADAVAAGQVGSASSFVAAGPFGDMDSLETRADDPLVVAWKKQAMELLERDAKARDLQAALSLHEEYRNGAITDVDIPRAFGSLVVAREIMLSEGEMKLSAAAQKELDRLSKRISQEQMAQAYQYVNLLKGKGGSQ